MERSDGRRPDELRPITVTRGYTEFAEGSALYSAGRTRVLVTASTEEKVPDLLRGTGKGWVTAEYSMLPRATETRTPRGAAKGRQSGRTQEIQRSAEGMPFTPDELQAMLDLGRKGIEEIVATQRRILAQAGEEPRQLRG